MSKVPEWRSEKRKGRATCSGYGGGGRSAKVADLKHQPHGGVQRDPLVTGQSQHLTGECVYTQYADFTERQRPLFLLFTQSTPGLHHLLSSALYTIISMTRTHCHLFSLPQSTNSLLLSRISDESTTFSHSYLNRSENDAE